MPKGFKLQIRRFHYSGSQVELRQKAVAFFDDYKGSPYFFPNIYLPKAVAERSRTGKLIGNLKKWSGTVDHMTTDDPKDNAMFMFGGMENGLKYDKYKGCSKNGAFCAELVAVFFDHVGAWPKRFAPITALPMNLDGLYPSSAHPIPGAKFDDPVIISGTGTLSPLERVVLPTRPDLLAQTTDVFDELFGHIVTQQEWCGLKSEM